MMVADEVPLDDKAKRMRDLLSSFYSPESAMSTGTDSAKHASPDDINSNSFDPDHYMNLMVHKSNLEGLLQRHVEMAAEIKNLDTDLQMLVYENYNKFISATDTIKRMKSNISGMETNMEQLLEKIMSMQSRSDSVNTSLFDKREHIEKLHRTCNLLRKVQVPPMGLFPNCLVQQQVLYPFWKQVGGTILSAKLAKERGWAINVGGGFHHYSAEKGDGFCAYADISLCIHFALVRLNISRVMIIDLDAHQGNGHETDFAYDSRVYILDMYNPGIYPLDYEARNYINQKVEVKSGTLTEDYLQKLDEALEVAGRSFDPELIVYNAGTDILDGDPLGRLKISPDGITLRDEKVFRFAREKNIPIVMLTSGGYMKSSARVIADSIVNLSKKCLIEDKQDS